MSTEREQQRRSHALTIGQLAAFSGVTIRAIRHYHQTGLLEEPPRDASGYRRYGAKHAIRLVKIKTLAQAGVPLGRIGELLTAPPDRFATAIAEIERRLQERVEELLHARDQIGRLRAGDRLFLADDVADFLDRLRQLGVSQRTLDMERDGWILLQAVSPKQAAVSIADKRAAMEDPEFCALYLEYDAAFEWSPDDPRLRVLADRTERWLTHWDGKSDPGEQLVPEPAIAQLMALAGGTPSPAWDRLNQIAKEDLSGG